MLRSSLSAWQVALHTALLTFSNRPPQGLDATLLTFSSNWPLSPDAAPGVFFRATGHTLLLLERFRERPKTITLYIAYV